MSFISVDTFWSRYSAYCIQGKICPLKSVIKHLKGTELCCPIESIREEHWLYLLSALFKDSSLSKVHFASCISPYDDQTNLSKTLIKRNKVFPTPYGRSEQNISDICKALAETLKVSNYLVFLKLEYLSLKILDAEELAKGLKESRVLRELSFAGCKFENDAVGIICKALHMTDIAWIDFSSCALNFSDVEAVCKIIKAHVLRRSNELFPGTLRYQFPVLDTMGGLNRISLNFNSMNASCVKLLVDCLTDDCWIKALDLQKCEIGNVGAEELLKVAKTNAQLEIIDLRLNNIDVSLLQRISQQLLLNQAGKSIKYLPMPIWGPSELVTKYTAKIIKKRKVPKSSPPKIKFVKGVPIRLNHSSASSTSSKKTRSDIKTAKNINVRDASSQTDEDIRMLTEQEFNEVKKKINIETRMRKFLKEANNTLKAENYQLHELLNEREKDDIYIDNETYFAVKRTFEKLKIFFEVMKRYGLWEYIATLGFNEITTISLNEDDSQKSVKITKKMMAPPKNHACCQESKSEEEYERDPCCSCRREDVHNYGAESSDNEHRCPKANKPSSTVNVKGDQNYNEKVAIQKIFQEMFNHYGDESQSPPSQQSKPVPVKQTNAASSSHDVKPTSNKQADAFSVAEAHTFIKKFSYSNMPKKLQELIPPLDFYKILTKELQRCGGEVKSASHSEDLPDENVKVESAKISGSHVDAVISQPDKDSTSSTKTEKNEPPASNVKPLPKVKPNKFEIVPRIENIRNLQNILKRNFSPDEDIDDISISELIARRRPISAKPKQAPAKYVPTKIEPGKSSSSYTSNAKSLKNSKSTNTQSKQEKSQSSASSNASSKKPLSKSSQKQSDSNVSRASIMKILTSNASSDEINSSDSIATSSGKLSDSSLSRSSSNKSLAKTDDQNENESVKSYIETVSDASTFKDVESISDIEVVSHVSSKNEPEIQENVSLVNVAEIKPALSDSKLEDASKSSHSNKSVTNSAKQGKKVNKNSGKNRPKSSSKSSSVPSLSDITTVSSQSLNTDSVMKQLSGSGLDAKN